MIWIYFQWDQCWRLKLSFSLDIQLLKLKRIRLIPSFPFQLLWNYVVLHLIDHTSQMCHFIKSYSYHSFWYLTTCIYYTSNQILDHPSKKQFLVIDWYIITTLVLFVTILWIFSLTEYQHPLMSFWDISKYVKSLIDHDQFWVRGMPLLLGIWTVLCIVLDLD